MLQIGLLVPRFWLYLDSVQILWCYVTNYYTVWTLLRPFIVWYSSLFFHSFFFFWTDDSFLTWYYTCFNPILPNHPSLSLSHRVQKTVLCIGVSFAVWLFLKNVLWVTFLSFGNCNNCLVVCWASLSSPLPGRTSEVNNQNTPRNQGIVLDELDKVFSLGYLHSVQNVFLWWPNDELLFWFSSFSFKTSLIPPCMPYTPPTPYFFSSSYTFWFSFPSICIF